MAAKKAARRSTRRSRSKPARTARKSRVRRAAARPKARSKAARAAKRAKPARAVKAAKSTKVRRAARPARTRVARVVKLSAAKRPAAKKPQPVSASTPAPAPKPVAAKPSTLIKDRRTRPAAKPALDRARRVLPEAERTDREADDRLIASARSGGEELLHELSEHTEASPTLTAGDVDADWQDAYAVGDEAPGGDNPTPDQDRVDEIGKALGVNYDDNEELQGSDKIVERDRHRWELDPASSDDWPHGDKD
jgi:hypothetical protein